jgi:hypothetical protein
MSDDAETPLRDYRQTVFLPETPFPMRAGLPQILLPSVCLAIGTKKGNYDEPSSPRKA